jgi:hypothetical protein
VAEVTAKRRGAVPAQRGRPIAGAAQRTEFLDRPFVGFRELELWRFTSRSHARVMLRCLAFDLRCYCARIGAR